MGKRSAILLFIATLCALQNVDGFQTTARLGMLKNNRVKLMQANIAPTSVAVVEKIASCQSIAEKALPPSTLVRGAISIGTMWASHKWFVPFVLGAFNKIVSAVTSVVSPGKPDEFQRSVYDFAKTANNCYTGILQTFFFIHFICQILSSFTPLITFKTEVLILESLVTAFLIGHSRKFLSSIVLPNALPDLDARKKFLANRALTLASWTAYVFLIGQKVATYFHIPLKSVLAFGGVSGLLLGLWSKDFTANVFGGLQLYLNDPFIAGEIITFKSGGTDILGKVESVGLTQTRLRDRETRTTYVPNSLVANALITNLDRISHRKFESVISIRYEDFARIPNVVAAIRKRLSSVPGIDTTGMPFRINFLRVTRNSLDIEIFCYFATKNLDEFMKIQQQANIAVLNAVKESDAALALPSSVIHFDEGDIPTIGDVPVVEPPKTTATGKRKKNALN